MAYTLAIAWGMGGFPNELPPPLLSRQPDPVRGALLPDAGVVRLAGCPAGSGIKRILNGAAGAATLLGILHPTLVRSCFFTDGHLTRLARWVARTFHIAEDELRGAVSFPAWWSIGVGIALFIINLFLKSPKAGP